MAAVLSPRWTSAAPMTAENENPSLRKLAFWLVIMVVIQILLGGAIRHDDHGTALLSGRDAPFYTHLGMHVLGAVALSYYLARVLFRVFKEHRQLPEILRPARFMMMLLGLQLILGTLAAVFKVIYSRDWLDADMPPPIRVWTATLHVAVGSLILALSAVLAVRAHRYLMPLAEEASDPRRTPDDETLGVAA
jgi:heme A synthase